MTLTQHATRRIFLASSIALLAACASKPSPDTPSSKMGLDEYKRRVAEKIYENSAQKVFVGQPQALLRAVIVLRFKLDAQGQLVGTEIMRSNKDREAENTALSSLRAATPFPPPPAHLLTGGRLEIAETWLFNKDGRFQLHMLAEKQKSE